jgi:hypothetical protein
MNNLKELSLLFKLRPSKLLSFSTTVHTQQPKRAEGKLET